MRSFPAPSDFRLQVTCLRLAGGAAYLYVRLAHPALGWLEALAFTVVPSLVSWLMTARKTRSSGQVREAVIQEQIKFVEARHEELRQAYLEQEETRVELRHKVNQLTALHRAGLAFSSMLDREALLKHVLHTLTDELHYDRAMISFYDPVRGCVYETRIKGVASEIEDFARSREIPVMDPETPEGAVLLKGQSLLVTDIHDVLARLHPLNQKLAIMAKTKCLIAVPIKTKDRLLGSLTVDRIQANSLTKDDMEVMVTVANQVAIALDNVSAYNQIEELNVNLEAKVRDRTAALEQFLARVSHDLRTPLTAIRSSPPLAGNW